MSQLWDGLEKHTSSAFSPFQSFSIKVMINILSSRQDLLTPWNLYLLLLDNTYHKPEIKIVPSGEENSISHWKVTPGVHHHLCFACSKGNYWLFHESESLVSETLFLSSVKEVAVPISAFLCKQPEMISGFLCMQRYFWPPTPFIISCWCFSTRL